MKPLAIDLFCGLGGWTEGLQAAGYRVVGFDIEQHVYGEARYPGDLVLQDVTTIDGAQFKDAALIVASPPCQAYSYRAMPWKKAKALPPPDNTLFEACFRIQREASAAAGRFIPLVVENVRGAQPYVGRARWHYGSFYLWGDVPALMPQTNRRKQAGNFHQTGAGVWNRGEHVGEGVKVSGLNWSNHGKPGYKADTAEQRLRSAVKVGGQLNIRNGHSHTRHLTNPDEHRKNGGDWFGSGADCSLQRRQSSKGSARKHAAAQIAKIPFPLAYHIGLAWLPVEEPASVGAVDPQDGIVTDGPRASKSFLSERL